MALTKVQKTGITDNAIDADKIEDGTVVAADIANGTITNDKLAGSIANDKLANSSITVNGNSVSLGGSVSAGKVQWQSVITADGSTATSAVAGQGYFIDTTSNAHTITLPGSPSIGDTIAIKDYAGTFGTNALTIGRNGNNIQGVANNSQIGTNRASVVLVYIDSTKGWLYTNESNVADLGEPLFITATGGTITTSGDFKIHSFTGDGCFVVATVGNGSSVPTGGPTNVDYLVVAGGGGGGAFGGGGGAGGYRTTFPSPGCNAGAFPITAITYPITVGAGGIGYIFPTPGSSGSPSTFSTITSAGGGIGGNSWGSRANAIGVNGGSGGGSGTANVTPSPWPGGTGNSPPVSPPQGNNGGGGSQSSSPSTRGFLGGGGGSGTSGSSGSPGGNGGAGGSGTANSITASPVTYAGGGGGGTFWGPATAGSGGPGGGGAGGVKACGSPGTAGSAGTINTGGGGGGGGRDGAGGGTGSGNGGSGVVIIRYKFQ